MFYIHETSYSSWVISSNLTNFWCGLGINFSRYIRFHNATGQTLTNVTISIEADGDTIALFDPYFAGQSLQDIGKPKVYTIASMAHNAYVRASIVFPKTTPILAPSYLNYRNIRLVVRSNGMEIEKVNNSSDNPTFWFQTAQPSAPSTFLTHTFNNITVLALPAKIHDGGTVIAPDKDLIYSMIGTLKAGDSKLVTQLAFNNCFPGATTEERHFILCACKSITASSDGSFVSATSEGSLIQNPMFSGKTNMELGMESPNNKKVVVEYSMPFVHSTAVSFYSNRASVASSTLPVPIEYVDHRKQNKYYFPFLNFPYYLKTLNVSDNHFFHNGGVGIPIKCRVNIREHLSNDNSKAFTIRGVYKV